MSLKELIGTDETQDEYISKDEEDLDNSSEIGKCTFWLIWHEWQKDYVIMNCSPASLASASCVDNPPEHTFQHRSFIFHKNMQLYPLYWLPKN